MSRRYLGGFITANPVTPTASAASGAWTLNQQMQANAAGNWPTGLGDPYFNYTSLLLSTTSLGNANNNLFVDSSGAFNPIARNGNATQGSFTPYSANWSNYFDGSGDYLEVTGSNLAMSTGSWTIEGWIYLNAYPGSYAQIYDSRFDSHGSTAGLTIYVGSTGTLRVYQGTDRAYTTSTISLATWTHFAAVYDGSTLKLYLNGTNSGTNWTASLNLTNTTIQIACEWTKTAGFQNAYISNFRNVKGTAVYTSNFTPPTASLTAISGTQLLTCQSNRFRDASTNNYTITRYGDTRVTDYSPFAPAYPGISYNQSDIQYWSNYLDNSGDYLTCGSGSSAFAFGTGDFTIEGWFYSSFATATWKPMLSVGAAAQGQLIRINQSIFTTGNWGMLYPNDAGNSDVYFDTGAAFPLNQWVHVALVRSGTTLTLYQNGTNVLQKTVGFNFTNTTGVSVGYGQYAGDGTFGGYVSNVRIVKGTAVYTGAFTPPTAPLTAITNTSLLTCQSAAFTDNSTNNLAIGIFGNTAVTGNNPFQAGYYSNRFDGSSDYLSLAGTSAFNLSSGDFTVEAWFYSVEAKIGTIIQQNEADWRLFANNGSAKWDVSGVTGVSGGSYSLNTWNHVAAVKSGSTTTLYLNGTSVGTTTTNPANSTGTIYIGGNVPPNTWYFNGYISNVRVVKGTAVYTSNFTPPTAPLTAVTNTSLLTCQSGRFADASTNNYTVTRTGDVSIQPFDPFYTSTIASNGGSMYFDGSGDYLTIPSTPALAPGTSDFTWEFWVYPTSFNDGVFWITDVANGFQVGFQNSTTWGVARAVIEWYMTSTTLPTLSAWNHIAVTRSGTNMALFLNGSRIATRSSATANFVAGTTAIMANAAGAAAVQGYTSNMRMVKGTAIYDPTVATYTVPTAPANPTPATTFLVNGMNAGIYDATAINDMETVGDAKVSTAVSKFGGSSMAFDGTGDYLALPSGPQFYFGTGDFTAEAWIYPTGGSGNRAVFSGNITNAFAFYINSTGKIAVAKSGVVEIIASTTTISTSTFTHVATTRSGNTFRIFVNGTLEATVTSSQDFTAFNDNRVGYESGSSYYVGYIDDLRITKGVARYTANFTPPTAALPTF
jgi:hypothetical protein